MPPSTARTIPLNRRTERQSPAKGARSYCKWLCSDVRSTSVKASLGTRRAFVLCSGKSNYLCMTAVKYLQVKVLLSRAMANLRRLRLHLRTVWSGDTRSILLQPMGRMERTDSRPRNALIHRESGSPPDYLPTPGSSVSSRARISVQAAPRFLLRPRTRCALRVRIYDQLHTSRDTFGVDAGDIYLLRDSVCGRKERWSGVTAEVWLRPSSVWHTRCIIRSKSRNESCAGQIWWSEIKNCAQSAPFTFPIDVQWDYCFKPDLCPVCMFLQLRTVACSNNLQARSCRPSVWFS